MTDQVAETVTPFTPEPATTVTDQVAPVAPVAPVTPVAPVFQIPDVAKELVGEGKKYSTPQDALAALPHAQSHISKLEEEMATLRETLATRDSAAEVLEAINNKTPEEATAPQFDPTQLDALIESKLTAKEAQAVKDANVSSVVNTFVEQYGDKEKAQEIYLQKAADLGLTVEHVNSLAATSPAAVYELFGFKPTTSTPSKITSNVNSEAVINNAQTPAPVKSVMGGSTHKDDIAAWNAAKPTE